MAKAAKKKAAASASANGKPRSKSEVFTTIAENTGLTRKQVASVFDEMNTIIKKDLSGRNAPGVFTVPGLMKIQVVKKPATKATQRPNPFKPGEMMTVAAKPARKTVKVRPLKGLKEMA